MTRLEGKRIAILVDDLYEEMEAWYPVHRLREEGAEVVIAGPEADKDYRGLHTYVIHSDVAIRDLDIDDLDGVVIPGGYAPDTLRTMPEVLELVRAAVQAEKAVAAICHAIWVLASADVIRERRITSLDRVRDDAINAGGIWSDEPAVADGMLVTSRTPADLPAFMIGILRALEQRVAA
jgi:protease I